MLIRRTFLFMPGNNPGMLANAAVLGADAVIFDLEDAVARTEKDAARILVRHALAAAHPGVPAAVRVNALDTPFWREDIAAAVAGGADIILLPKTDCPEGVEQAASVMAAEEARLDRKPLALMALVESSLGVENAFAIARAHKRLAGILLGAEDLTAELGARRSARGDEIFYARSRVLMACKAAGVLAVDTPYPFVTDMEGLAADAALAAGMGFDGKAVISPHHVHAVNSAFSPAPEQVRWAERVLAAARRAEAEGKGAVSLDGMMIDAPVIKRAERYLLLAGRPVEAGYA